MDSNQPASENGRVGGVGGSAGRAPGPYPDEAEHIVEPTFAPWDGRRVPVTLLSGYLGSGKTTTINHLLARTDRPIAVLVNDVGAVNIDAALIARQTSDTIELTDGCVCCSMVNGFVEAFEQLRQRETPPDHVIVELSGVAEPARAAPWAGTIGFQLDGIVVLVDAEQFQERSQDEYVGPLVQRQVEAADLVVITKRDLSTPAKVDVLRAQVRELAPHAPIITSDAPDTIAGILNLATRRPGGVTDLPQPILFDVHDVTTVPVPDPVKREELDRLLNDLGPNVVRAKGVFNVTEPGLDNASPVLVQIVGKRREVEPLRLAESQPPTPLVVITTN